MQESIPKKRLTKKRWDMQRDEESKQEYKEMRPEAKKDVAKARARHMMSCTRRWTLRKKKIHRIDWRDRYTKRERAYNRSE